MDNNSETALMKAETSGHKAVALALGGGSVHTAVPCGEVELWDWEPAQPQAQSPPQSTIGPVRLRGAAVPACRVHCRLSRVASLRLEEISYEL